MMPERIPEREPEPESEIDRKCREVWDRINKRDPRTDPQPGDVICSYGNPEHSVPITVTKVLICPEYGTTTVFYACPERPSNEISLENWVDWAMKTGAVSVNRFQNNKK